MGSLAYSEGDRWSDLDLSFGVADGISILEVLDDFTADLVKQFGAVHLFDLPSDTAVYRVFLLPGCLQLDLSCVPASDFGATGPDFKPLFGRSVPKPHIPPPAAFQLFGYAVHHALRARFCIERHRYWQAEYWISAIRDNALTLGCRRRGLATYYGRGFDDLPQDLRDRATAALLGSLDREALIRALGWAIDLLLGEADEVRELAITIEGELRGLTIPQLE